MKKPHYIVMGVGGVILYLVSTGLSFAFFRTQQKIATLPTIDSKVTTTPKKNFVIDPSIPRTEPCPLNGKLYTKQEKTTWEKRRPLVAMVENSFDARPQSGISYADVIYEAVAEGGITRFMGVFYCGIAAEAPAIAPVRSARIYFINWAAEYGDKPIYMHIGGANDFSGSGDTANEAKALEVLESMKWRIPGGNDFDTTYDMGFPTFARNPDRLGREVAVEHTMVAKLDKALKEAEKRGFTNEDSTGKAWDASFTAWKFKEDAKESERGASFSASFVAWPKYEENYGVKWEYDPKTNEYARYTGGQVHKDLETDEQLKAKVVVIVFAKERGPVDNNAHLLYQNIGTGNGLLFQDGKATTITWSKASRTARTVFTDTSGREVSFNKGQLWIHMLPIATPVHY